MRGYYIHPVMYKMISTGVNKKIQFQMGEFCKHFETSEIELVLNDNYIKKVLFRLCLTDKGYNYPEVLDGLADPDFIYMRKCIFEKKQIEFWREVKRRYPRCKNIVEIPTYPYDKDDFGGLENITTFPIEKKYRRNLVGLIDRFVTYSQYDEIFGVKTIRTMNGIDVASVIPVAYLPEKKQIDLIAVAMFQKHHGYERLIKGLKNYYNGKHSVEVKLHLVGEGYDLKKYKELVTVNHMEDRIKFYGQKTGKELDHIYAMSDIAVSSLGLHRIDIHYGTSIKSKEYLAKGLPIITSCDNDCVDQSFKYCLRFEEDDSDIDVNRIVDFYNMIRKTGVEQVRNEIRRYAKQKVDIGVVMNPIIEYIKEKNDIGGSIK